jgi:hypothetical protein
MLASAQCSRKIGINVALSKFIKKVLHATPQPPSNIIHSLNLFIFAMGQSNWLFPKKEKLDL